MEEILSRLPAPMQLDGSILIVAVIFLVLLVILNSLVFKPLMTVLDERQARIDEGEAAAKKAQQTVEESQAALRVKKTEALQKAQSQRQEMLAEVENTRSSLVNEARTAARTKIDESGAKMSAQVAEARASLEQETKSLAEQIAGRILSRA